MTGPAGGRRFVRVVLDIEVEITDVTEAATYTMDWGTDEHGNVGMIPYADDHEQIAAAVNRTVSETLHTASGRGFKWVQTSMLPLRRDDKGNYLGFTIGSQSARNGDGSVDE